MQRLHCPTRRLPGAPLLLVVTLLSACGGGGETPTQEQATVAVPTPATGAPAVAPTPESPAVDTCSLLTKAEVEAAAGRAVMDLG